MTPDEIVDRVWELAKKIDFCMFVTWDGERQQARPLSARVEREEHAIYFLVSANGHKIEQIERFPVVNLVFADTGSMKYVSISGQAMVSNDRAKIKDLWNAFDKAWWDDENDPDIRLLTVTPERAELWDSPNKAIAFSAMLVSAVTGAKPKMGDNGTVRL
ncbi:MAG: pyridoxamine 5'-phosphate oxidase family protein [Devosia sp.]